MRVLAFRITLCFFLFLCGKQSFAGVLKNTQKTDKEKRDLTALQGAWEQISLQRATGRLEKLDRPEFDFLKVVYVIRGSNCYEVSSLFFGVKVTKYDISLGQSEADFALDLVNPDDNRTVRSLCNAKGDQLTFCWHGGGKTATRPKQIATTTEGFSVYVFKKLSDQIQKNTPEESGSELKSLSGLWNTTEFENAGITLRQEESHIEFGRSQRVFYFQKNQCTVVNATEGGALNIVHKPYQKMPSKGKQAIDFMTIDDQIIPAIYRCQENELTICWNANGGKRPDEFRTEKGDGRELMRLKRIDKENQQTKKKG